MHATFQYADPQECADDQVGAEPCHAKAVHQDQDAEKDRRQDQRQVRQFAGVEQGNDDDRAEVINDRQGHQKQFQRHRHALAQQGQYAEGEGDIGGHGDGPAAGGRRVVMV